jgi:hypothetical protein
VISAQRGDVIRFIAAKGLTPLFKISRVKKSLLASVFGGSKPITFGGVADTRSSRDPTEDVFEHVAPEV